MKERDGYAVDPACRGGPQRTIPRLLLLAALVFGVALAVGTVAADAHNWDGWHWNRGGSSVALYINDETGGCTRGGTATNDAIYDIYYNPHPLYLYCVGYHTDISVFQAYNPGAWYCGLANVSGVYTNVSGQLHITHAHAQWNTACSSGGGLSGKAYAQAIFCQEIGHALGLDHSNTNDCMGFSYPGLCPGCTGRWHIGNTGGYVYDWDHQSSDLYYRYRYHSPH